MNRVNRWFFLGLILLTAISVWAVRPPGFLREAFPEAHSILPIPGNYPLGVAGVWKAEAKSGQLLGYLALAEAQGFNGPVKLVSSWVPGRGVAFLKVVEHRESQDYGGEHMHSPWFTQQYLGNIGLANYTSVKNLRTVPNDVYIITGATASSQAVTLAANQCLEVFRQLEGRK